MECYLKWNSLILVVAYCLFVTALGLGTNYIGNEDPLSIPLINDKGAPLVAMLDTKSINRKMKVYIRTLMKDMIQRTIQEQMQGIFKTALEENSTIEFIRNITLQEINDATITKHQGQEGISSPPLAKYKDCTEIQRQTKKKLDDGVYSIYPGGDNPVQAYCDMTTDGGGWTVMLKRNNGSVSFKRRWIECENGFGDIHAEFWFCNKYTNMLTSSEKYELRVDMVDPGSQKTYAVYKTFVVGDAASKYKLTVGDYSGNAGDRLKYHNGKKFTTIDQDNDTYDKINCAVNNGGSWWYYKCSACDLSRTNGNLYWAGTVSKAVMMIRKI
ncbi:fibrinogen-like protein A [Mytilus trossulus]|uniref:fibrinogen-like protein A n=1 Tax=Mytilus trossulus TaxID=6551 RepID=UPI0030075A21